MLTTLAEALAGAAAGFHARGWCVGTSGNFSAVLEREPLRLLVTQSGRDKGRLRAEDFAVVDEAGRPLSAGSAASAETGLHLAVVRASGAGCVLHTHSVAATLLGEHFRGKGGFTITGYEMLKGLEGVRSHEAAVFVPVLANSQDVPALAREVTGLFAQQPELRGFLLAGHGLYTWGTGLDEARRHVEIFEFLLEALSRRVELEPFVG